MRIIVKKLRVKKWDFHKRQVVDIIKIVTIKNEKNNKNKNCYNEK